ncbi:MAG: ATP synthase F1 subunit epsilon [Candidatus Saccharimonadales bacterium]
MNLQLVALDGVKLNEDIYSIILPTASGEIGVYPGHEPLVSVLVPGTVTVRRQKNDPDGLLEHFATFGGVLEVTHDGVKVLVDEAESDISETEVEKARQVAVKLKSEAKNQQDLDKAQAMIDRQAVRLNVAKLRRHR